MLREYRWRSTVYRRQLHHSWLYWTTVRRLLPPLSLLVLLLAGCASEGNVFSLAVGDCFDDPSESAGEISDVAIVDCTEPHDNEVFHVIDVADGTFPGDAALAEQAQAECLPAFEAYVGTTYEESALDVFPITPTAGSWEAGDRQVVCALYDVDLAKLTGSMQGTAT